MTEPDDPRVPLAEGMLEAMEDFRLGRSSLHQLCWELKSRIAALRAVADEEWVDELKAWWNRLDVVNAFFIESRRDSLQPDELQEIDGVLSRLRAELTPY